MRKILLVIKYEIITTLQKRSFWLLTFIFPAFILILTIGTQTIGERAIEEAEEQASSVEYQAKINRRVGYVDQADLITEIPPWIPEDFFQKYQDVSGAEDALRAGKIQQFYVLPADFMFTGKYELIDQEYQPMRSTNNAEIFEEVITTNLIQGEELGTLLDNPTPGIQYHQLSTETKYDEDNMLTYIVPIATMFIFFFTITTSSGFMLTSVTREKENRTAEILLVSIKPRELMLGKVIGLGCVALFQMSIWMGGAIFSMDRSSEYMGLASSFSLPSGFVIWGILYFLCGYFLYASLLGAVGALAPNAREGGQFTFIILLPLMIPIWFNFLFIDSPNGPLAVFLSLFPLTSISMMTRMTATSVPNWQIITSLGGLVISTYIIILFSARFFKAETLLSTDSLKFKNVIRAFR